MADLIDILKGINRNLEAANPSIKSDFSSVQPKIDDSEFYTAIQEEIDGASIITAGLSDNQNLFHIGCGSDPDTLKLGQADIDAEAYKNVFLGYKGSIGKGGIFPYISDYPDVSNLPDEVIQKFFGNKALGGKAQIDNDTHIKIGDGAKDCIPKLDECIERVFISSIVRVGGMMSYNVGLTDLDSIETHEQGEPAITISDGKVTIHKPAFKRNINIEPCGSSIRKSSVSENDGGVRYAGDQLGCIEELQEFYASKGKSTKLVRQP